MRKNITWIPLSALIFLLISGSGQTWSQGCVAIRSVCGANSSAGSGAILMKGEFLLGFNNRYFESYKHFRGTVEETERVENGTQVINNSYFADLTLNYGFADRWFAAVTVPYVHHLRSSLYEHGGNSLGDRRTTSASGLSDIRAGVGYWLFDPAKHPLFNYSVALGIKLPTGSYAATDEFYNQGSTKDSTWVRVVDQSIQPGDGGYGITLDIQGYHSLSKSFMLYTNLYYMSNPMEDNGVLTRSGSQYFSCPDQYAARLGLTWTTPVKGLAFGIGGRWEGVPSDDLVGSSAGYRRPGYVISADPTLTYTLKKFTFNLNLPVAVERNRVQSYQDKVDTENTGVYKIGDAAFADYVVNFSVLWKFGGTRSGHTPPAHD
jgi:hypothetical protein